MLGRPTFQSSSIGLINVAETPGVAAKSAANIQLQISNLPILRDYQRTPKSGAKILRTQHQIAGSVQGGGSGNGPQHRGEQAQVNNNAGRAVSVNGDDDEVNQVHRGQN